MLKKKIKSLSILTLLLLMLFIFSAFNPAAALEVNINAPNVPAAIPFLWMQEEAEVLDSLEINLNLSSDHQRGISLIAQNEIDFLLTGSNVGANAYNRGVDLKLLNINTWAIDYLLTYDFEIEEWQELKSKSLALPLQGGPLDFLARYLLEANAVDPESVNFVYRSLPGAAQYFMAGNLDAIILPEPLVTVTMLNSEEAVLSMDIQEEWAEVHGDPRIPFVGLFVSGKFAEENPQFTNIINGYYGQGVNWVNENPAAAAELAAEHFDMPAPVIEQSLSRVDLNIYPEAESRALVELYFSEILEMYPEMIGGQMVDEEFYF
ncbi:ABC transporter substrate-binding protein [Halanaerobium hydrogeniformans]|uniref:SsuA/THI5-like domain-containing protein n=1 Tax=Halanaerobium hydrogeniformans TaxID=656519 RepID=E4RN14_HALHG|nr:ABC transporter substrate-binding protein [Halanaerobium hydrogeniformans]ADQ14231.1 hypothetical protein Halsa_0784 [Halanaerobium hydrogeniformans]